MKTTKISDLKAHLSAYLKRVRRGEHLLVMDRDEPVAEISPVAERNRSAIERLILEGKIIPGKGNLKDLKFAPLGRNIKIQDLLDEVREDKV